VQLIYNILRDN